VACTGVVAEPIDRCAQQEQTLLYGAMRIVVEFDLPGYREAYCVERTGQCHRKASSLSPDRVATSAFFAGADL
jgi:hypothetical protein